MKNLIAYILFVAGLVAAPAYAQLCATCVTIPVMDTGNHDAHDYSFGPTRIPQLATIARVVFDNPDQLRSNQTLTVVIKRSFGGVNFEPGGGDVFDSVHQPATFAVAIPQAGNPDRVLEGRITLFGAGRWKGKAFIEIE
jgi:hypothetical protein